MSDIIVNSEKPLTVEVKDDQLIISVGILRLNGNERHPEIPELNIEYPDIWACEIINELLREEEDGSTRLSDLLDKCIIAAIENGALGIAEDSPTHIGPCEKCGEEFSALTHTKQGQICQDCIKAIKQSPVTAPTPPRSAID